MVEDDPVEMRTCRSTVERYQDYRQIQVELVECGDVDEALDKLDNTFDGAIIDLRLGDEGDEGNQVIKRIKERRYRFPVAILTGTPSSAEPEFSYLGIYTKGNPGAGYEDLLDRFWRIQNTGLTRILGGTGTIESRLADVFWTNLLPQMKKWEGYGEVDSSKTEDALLRHTLNHLIQVIDEEIEGYYPEEFYLHPPPSEKIRTGSILKEKGCEKWFVVMSPDCDLVARTNGKPNTDVVLVVEVVAPRAVLDWFDSAAIGDLSKGQRRQLERAMKNNKSNYFHCLPKTDFSPFGFLNFRYLSTIREKQISERFEIPPRIQVSPPFVKDMVARFSSYYARQGQPDINLSDFIGH